MRQSPSVSITDLSGECQAVPRSTTKCLSPVGLILRADITMFINHTAAAGSNKLGTYIFCSCLFVRFPSLFLLTMRYIQRRSAFSFTYSFNFKNLEKFGNNAT